MVSQDMVMRQAVYLRPDTVFGQERYKALTIHLGHFKGSMMHFMGFSLNAEDRIPNYLKQAPFHHHLIKS